MNAETTLANLLTQNTPYPTLTTWMRDAKVAVPSYPEAAQLATADRVGLPNIRTVLVRDLGEEGFVFFTNTNSAKGQELRENPQGALLFYWRPLGRQIRVRGAVAPVSPAEADAYFAGRPRESQIGAHASKQSATLESRSRFETELDNLRERFADEEVPRPPHWSGFRLLPREIEFWQERPFRLHERVLFKRMGDHLWQKTLLYP